jgi:hypothetical protein
MASPPETSPEILPDLFAAKGRAMPACSEPLVSRQTLGTPPKPDKSDDKPQDDGPASVLSIDLRRALVPAQAVSSGAASPEIAAPAPNEAKPAPSASHRITPSPPPQGQGMAGPFIAALVAISIAGGVFYVFETDRYGARHVAEEPAAGGTENASSEDPARAPEAGQPQNAPASKSEADTAPEGTIVPSFDLVRVEPDGSAVIAGRAAPYADLILLHNGEPIGKVKADWAGEWAFVTDKPLPADRHRITILVNDPDAAITLPEGAEPPARISGMGFSQPR